MRKKILTRLLLIILVAALLIIYFCNRVINNAAAGKLYSTAETIPFNKTGLLLGTSRLLQNGTINPYYLYRIDAAEQLIKSGKIKHLIISGDNGRNAYNEPMDMQNDLIARGIDSTIIFLDYAGFRTFDSVVRLKKIFGQNKITIISQQFHNERAIYLCSKEDIDAIAFNAKNVGANKDIKIKIREKLARVKVFVDFLFNKEPKYVGAPVIIPA